MRREDIHDSMVGNALEALIGAIYLDHGFKKTQRAVLLMLKHYGLDEQVNETHDFKSKLHQWATKRKKKLSFDVLRDDDTAGEERYEIAAKVNGEVYGIGIGRSKKLAEQEAASAGVEESLRPAHRRQRRFESVARDDEVQVESSKGKGGARVARDPSRRRRDSGSSKAKPRGRKTQPRTSLPTVIRGVQREGPLRATSFGSRANGGLDGGSGSGGNKAFVEAQVRI